MTVTPAPVPAPISPVRPLTNLQEQPAMAEYAHRTITTIRHEFVVPADEPFGAPHAEIGKAWAAAEQAYRQHYGLRDEERLSDDAIAFRPGSGAEIVISFETRSEA